jgi:hypothetical protein
MNSNILGLTGQDLDLDYYKAIVEKHLDSSKPSFIEQVASRGGDQFDSESK